MENTFYTFRDFKDGKVNNIVQRLENTPPGPGFERVPNDWGGNHGDKSEWFDSDGRRIPDTKLVEQGLRADNRGVWYNTAQLEETKHVHNLDEEAGEGFTREQPLEHETYQMWDEKTKKWIIDGKRKKVHDKQRRIAEKQAEIEAIEKKLIRPAIALMDAELTPEESTEEQRRYALYLADLKKFRAERKALEQGA